MKKLMLSLLFSVGSVFLFQSASAEGECVTSTTGRVTGECFTAAGGSKRCIKTTPVDCAGVIIVHELE
jgi:hypothetical protein